MRPAARVSPAIADAGKESGTAMKTVEINGVATGLFSRREAGGLLGIAPRTIWLWATVGVKGKTLGHVTIGGSKFYTRADLDAFIAHVPNTYAATSPPPVATPRTPPEVKARLREKGYKV